MHRSKRMKTHFTMLMLNKASTRLIFAHTVKTEFDSHRTVRRCAQRLRPHHSLYNSDMKKKRQKLVPLTSGENRQNASLWHKSLGAKAVWLSISLKKNNERKLAIHLSKRQGTPVTETEMNSRLAVLPTPKSCVQPAVVSEGTNSMHSSSDRIRAQCVRLGRCYSWYVHSWIEEEENRTLIYCLSRDRLLISP